MEGTHHICRSSGFSLTELLVVVAILGICLAAGAAGLSGSLKAEEARGAAQTFQAAAAWAQVGVLWQGGTTRLSYDQGELALQHDQTLCGGSLGRAAPEVEVETNVRRWDVDDGARVSFSGPLAAPDGGGSVFFQAVGGEYRVVIRPESGLTVRTLVRP